MYCSDPKWMKHNEPWTPQKPSQRVAVTLTQQHPERSVKPEKRFCWFHFCSVAAEIKPQRRAETVWPGPRTLPRSDGPKHTRTGWDMRRRWTTPTAPPTNSRGPVLTCPSPRGESLACANVCRISLRRGDSYGGAEFVKVRQRRKERKSIQCRQHLDQNL